MSYHVPEFARNTTHPVLATTSTNGNNGAFDLESPEPGWRLMLICSDCSEPEYADARWEHVSVHAYREHSRIPAVLGRPTSPFGHSLALGTGRTLHPIQAMRHQLMKPITVDRQTRTPNWKEMVFVKDLCWDDEDVVMQLHPKRSEYVNEHPHTLHLWRPLDAVIPTPPSIFVGEKDGQTATT